MRIASPIVFAWLAIAGAAASADERVTAQPFEYPFEVAVFDLPVASNGIRYRLYVRPPLSAPAEGEKAATFYFLDAIRTFVPAAAMTSNYEFFNYTPAAYFVGIGYRDEADGIPKAHNRTRDYTPTRFEPPDETHFLAGNPAAYEGSGGADAFFDVVEKEIIPFIESRYEVDDDRVLIGNSMSGLAAVHALLTRPGLFRRYVITSPSIWWDDWFDARDERYVMRMAAQTAGSDYPVVHLFDEPQFNTQDGYIGFMLDFFKSFFS